MEPFWLFFGCELGFDPDVALTGTPGTGSRYLTWVFRIRRRHRHHINPEEII